MITSGDIRRKFLSFFKEKGHKIIPSSSLLSDDPSVLLTTAGVQQFKPYYTGKLNPESDFGSRRVASVQKCFRTSDIDEVGDESHLTFFEMLGNFSFGDYFKKEAIEWGYEFLTGEMDFDLKRMSATYLEGDKESLAELKKYFPAKKIRAAGKENNFWGPVGDEGPCGPTVEFYIDGIEVWNLVFNQYYCQKDKKLKPLKSAGVDTGMGLERLTAVAQGASTVFEIDLFSDLMKLIPSGLSIRTKRIVADHARGIAFLIADGVRPSNKEAGYILRRLIRRAVTQVSDFDFEKLLGKVADLYQDRYPELKKQVILVVFDEEKTKFEKTLKKGVKELEGLKSVDAKTAFKLYETFGLPYEVIKDIAGRRAARLKRADFDKEFEEHQKISRAGLEKKFGGHGLILDTGELKAGDKKEMEKVIRLHTATHLLQQALRDVLGPSVRQAGSDINAERTRFDFNLDRKMTPEEIKKVEEIVNKKIKENLPVNFEELSKKEAEKTGALHFFKAKYPEKVRIYYIGKSLQDAYSKEFCGGPHVKRTGEIGRFKIAKEESVAADTRRIRGVVIN